MGYCFPSNVEDIAVLKEDFSETVVLQNFK